MIEIYVLGHFKEFYSCRDLFLIDFYLNPSNFKILVEAIASEKQFALLLAQSWSVPLSLIQYVQKFIKKTLARKEYLKTNSFVF